MCLGVGSVGMGFGICFGSFSNDILLVSGGPRYVKIVISRYLFGNANFHPDNGVRASGRGGLRTCDLYVEVVNSSTSISLASRSTILVGRTIANLAPNYCSRVIGRVRKW